MELSKGSTLSPKAPARELQGFLAALHRLLPWQPQEGFKTAKQDVQRHTFFRGGHPFEPLS
jgi:hypothetical protein